MSPAPLSRPTEPLVFKAFDLPDGNQRLLGAPHPPGTVNPLALEPSRDNVQLSEAIEAIRHLQSQNGYWTQKLAVHGTLLFRGFPIANADDFSAFVHAFGYKPHEVIGNVIVRPKKAPNVSPANEGPPSMRIYSHNESAQLPHSPGYIFFYGHRVPVKGAGGETPSSSSLELFHRANQEIPEFVAELGAKGVLSIVTYKADKQYPGGSTLLQAFGKDVLENDTPDIRRAKIESEIKRYLRGPHTEWEWHGDEEQGETLVVTHRLPAVRTQPHTGLPALFTGLAAYWKAYELMLQGDVKIAGVRRDSMVQRYGDGTIIPDRYLARLASITDEIRVLHVWERGDVLVYDNLVAQHGREPWVGEQGDRLVLASLFDSTDVVGSYAEADWSTIVPAAGA